MRVSLNKIFATLLLRSWFPLIWFASWPCTEKVDHNFRTLREWGGSGVCGQNICYHFAAFLIFFIIWYATWPCSEKVEFWPVDPIPRVGSALGSASKIFANVLLHSWFPLIWYASWRCYDKAEFWSFDPSPKLSQGITQVLDHKSRLIYFIFIVPL